jgi:hypothetical protein
MPKSLIINRSLGIAEETNQFEEIREDDNALKKVYDSVSK